MLLDKQPGEYSAAALAAMPVGTCVQWADSAGQWEKQPVGWQHIESEQSVLQLVEGTYTLTYLPIGRLHKRRKE